LNLHLVLRQRLASVGEHVQFFPRIIRQPFFVSCLVIFFTVLVKSFIYARLCRKLVCIIVHVHWSDWLDANTVSQP
jgi:hypothetical protein